MEKYSKSLTMCYMLQQSKEKKVPAAGPMHFTASNEPVAISQDGDTPTELEPQVFALVCTSDF